jgi:hypothetical protein
MYIPPKVPRSDSGTATLGMRVARALRRKTNTTSTTRMIEMRSEICTSKNDARIVVVRSSTTDSFMAGGMEAWRRGRRASTLSTVSMMLAPGCRNTTRSTARLPLARPALRMSSTESCTSAMSPRRTGAPLR